jgi:hypothetical protein
MSATLEEAQLAFASILDMKEDRRIYRLALAGDGSGAASTDVTGMPGWTWVRYSEDPSKASIVRNVKRPNVEAETLLVIGKEFPDDEYEQVLDVDLSVYWDTLTEHEVASMAVGRHGDAHNAATGNDPAPIDLRNILEGRGRATDPASLWVYIEPFRYTHGGLQHWPGGLIDLTDYEPGVAGTHCYILVYLDPESAAGVEASASDPVPAANTPAIPDIPDGSIPICIVDLANGDTEIQDGDNLYDYRILWLPVNGFVEDYRLVAELAQMRELLQRQIDVAMGLIQGLLRAIVDLQGDVWRALNDHINGD